MKCGMIACGYWPSPTPPGNGRQSEGSPQSLDSRAVFFRLTGLRDRAKPSCPLPRESPAPMTDVTIKRALLSVSDKSGLIELGTALGKHGVELVSTGGTAKALREAGLEVKDISDLTGFPEMMDGRVKTLHPKVHGGLLAVRNNAEHVASMNEHEIGAIDLVVVNLYPFAATVAKGADRDEIIENIDIGEIGRAVQQECRDRSRMPSSA
eukprot:TRINITY_DN44061_c0_g1_i1.p2 TRINITY_DN44061_c0_g1~~TRINITY_DN44061_c0_g1_i1.p2  ORF type:complete len:209 (+),score=45.16 TRINITY_DN44061_c0_g1_i1:208-834(+)